MDHGLVCNMVVSAQCEWLSKIAGFAMSEQALE